MPSRWERSPLEQKCGHCRRPIYRGQPMRVFTFAGLSPRVQKRRCQDCAGEPAPKDLPALPGLPGMPAPTPKVRKDPRLPFGMEALTKFARDFRVRQAGDE